MHCFSTTVAAVTAGKLLRRALSSAPPEEQEALLQSLFELEGPPCVYCVVPAQCLKVHAFQCVCRLWDLERARSMCRPAPLHQ